MVGVPVWRVAVGADKAQKAAQKLALQDLLKVEHDPGAIQRMTDALGDL